MTFQLIGVNHKSAPVEVRERLNIPESRLPHALESLLRHAGVDEGLILCTCNRVEVLAHSQNGHADLRGFLREYFRSEPDTYEAYLYEFREREAIRHLFRVAASLDSAGASLGCIGLSGFAFVLWKGLDTHSAAITVSVGGTAWLLISYALWRIRANRILTFRRP